ncbi:hypothetical protein GCM10027180_08890 [Microbulbifer echini]
MLYVLLTVLRAPKVWGIGANLEGNNPLAKFEPRVSANLTNQFEWPVLFYSICTLLIARPELYKSIYLWLAWLFIIGRILHSGVQIFTANIRFRGLIFTINFIAVLFMWFFLGLDILA